MLYTTRIHMHTTQYIFKYKYRNSQIHRQLSVVHLLLTSDFGSLTWGERQFLKVFHNHTILKTPQRLVHLVVQSQFLNIMVGHQILTINIGPQLQLSAIEADNPTVCLHGPMSTPNLCFSKFPNSQPISSVHDIIHTPAPFLIWGLLWHLWLSYPLRASVNCTQCYAPELRAK